MSICQEKLMVSVLAVKICAIAQLFVKKSKKTNTTALSHTFTYFYVENLNLFRTRILRFRTYTKYAGVYPRLVLTCFPVGGDTLHEFWTRAIGIYPIEKNNLIRHSKFKILNSKFERKSPNFRTNLIVFSDKFQIF